LCRLGRGRIRSLGYTEAALAVQRLEHARALGGKMRLLFVLLACRVVVGARSAEVTESVRGLPVEILEGFDWREGMAASIRTAALWAIDRGADALMLCVCDQPFLTAHHLNALWFASANGKRLAASYYAGKTAVPAIFPERYFGALLALRGDEGGAGILRREANVAHVAWPEGAVDVDTPSDLLSL